MDDQTAWLDDPWIVGSNLDTSGLSQTDRDAYLKKVGKEPPKREDPFSQNEPTVITNQFRQSLEQLARDPEVRRELAERGQSVGEYDRGSINQIAGEFARREPKFLLCSSNNEKLISFLAHRYLGESNDFETDARDLLLAGKFTVENLQEAFDALSSAGGLRMPKDFVKPLTESELMAVATVIQSEGMIPAALRFMEYSLGRRLSPTESFERLKEKHPKLITTALLFVYRNGSPKTAMMSDADLDQFQRDVIQRYPLGFSLAMLQEFHDQWSRHRAVTRLSEPQQIAPADLDNLSDDEVRRLYRETVSEQRRSR